MAKMVTYLAGVNFRPGARERLAELIPGEGLDLRREPENPYDRNAVAVYDGEQHLGYVPRADALAVSTALRLGHLTTATYTALVSTTEITIMWEVV